MRKALERMWERLFHSSSNSCDSTSFQFLYLKILISTKLMHFWCRTMLSSVRISGEWIWKGTESLGQIWLSQKCHWRNKESSILLLRTTWSWERHFLSWRMQLSTAQLQCLTLDMLYKHCCPSYGDERALLASQMVPSSIPGPSHSNTLGIFVSFILKGKQVTFGFTGVTRKLLRFLQ